MTAIGHATEVEIQYRQRLEALYEAVGIIVKYYALVKQSIGVEDFLKFLHNIVGLITPLVLNKRSHISTCAVFGLKRTVITINHKFSHITHHLCIASHLVLIGETLMRATDKKAKLDELRGDV
jgi:fumarate reductase subunit C